MSGKRKCGMDNPLVVAAKENGRYVPMESKQECVPGREYVDTGSLEGIRIYRDSLVFVLIKAVHDLYPGRKLKVHYSISKGSFCDFPGQQADRGEIEKIKERMQELIRQDIPIEKHVFPREKAIGILLENNKTETAEILEDLGGEQVELYTIGSLHGYFHSQLAPSTGYVGIFDIRLYAPGFILFYPTRFNPFQLPPFQEQKKLFQVFREFSEWGSILNSDDVASINRQVSTGTVKELILVNEALHEKKVAYIAERVKKTKKTFIMIAGPSSSGKTSFASRLRIQLKAGGIHSSIISLDDYYRDRNTIPEGPDGEQDLEALDALDVDLFNNNMQELLQNRQALVPAYDFLTQNRKKEYRSIRMEEGDVILIEGIHALNPRMVRSINPIHVYKIYISALTSINIDDHNRFSTTDSRLIRRITRDIRYRGASVEKTILMWPSVRRGEDLYIFPFQEHADIMFNSALIYEHGVLKKIIQPLLEEVPPESPAFTEARRLLEILSFFREMDDCCISGTSLLREFIGGSHLI
ncbi:MAG: nucleoside kinase [Clostridia bacterium]